MIEYRRADVNDIETLAQIRVEFLEESNEAKAPDGFCGRQADYYARKIPCGEYVSFVATESGRIVGTSGVCFYEQAPSYSNLTGRVAYILNMYTKPAYRGRGVASTLFQKALDEARARGCSKVWLNATDMGHPLYEKFGFRDVSGDMNLILDS